MMMMMVMMVMMMPTMAIVTMQVGLQNHEAASVFKDVDGANSVHVMSHVHEVGHYCPSAAT